MDNPKISNPNDFKVVEFHNTTDFDFTPELGAMYDSRPLFVGSGERRQFPYHIGHRLAVNLAKAVLIKGAPLHDPNANVPVGVPLWGDEKVRALESSFITELYMDEKPIIQSETDRPMSRVVELEKLFNAKQAEKPLDAPREQVKSVAELLGAETPVKDESVEVIKIPAKKVYQDKQEVMAELEKRGIIFDRRQKKENLEKLLV